MKPDEYVVETILNHQKRNDRTEYFVAWRGYDERTWEPAKHLKGNDQFKKYIREVDPTGFVHENTKAPL